MKKKFFTLTSLMLLNACGGGSGGSTVATSDGVFINSPTKGIKYSASPSGLTGTTDENGKYVYKAGDTVTFSLDLGGSVITLGTTSNPSASTSVLSLSVPNGGDPLAVAQVLETLDKSSVDGRMDVSGININAGAVLTAITNAVKSTSVSSADIGTIATGVQTALTASGSGTLKNGTSGVTQNMALTNLSKHSANQSLLQTKIQNLPYDGSSTLLNIQDKPFFSSWISKENSQSSFTARFGLITNNGLTYNFKYPYNNTQDDTNFGTYTLANSNRDGAYTDGLDNSSIGTFSMKTGDANSFSLTWISSNQDRSGTISGTFLASLTLNDIKSKSFTIYGGCSDGTNNTVSINSSGIASATCTSDVNGATFTAGPYTNVLQYQETNGKRHYIGITRIDKKGVAGNLPTGAIGNFVDVSSSNFSKQPDQISFKVN